jgi:cysteinyl-tRNA synthetase
MAHSYLGESFDIHGGGLDLIFPHHENEIAQSEAAGYGFANVWMHNAWVTQSGEKMSKSLGNTMQVKELVKQVRGIELRFYLGSAHYRSMLEFSPEALQEAATNFQRIENFLVRAKEIVGDYQGVISDSVKQAFDDDLAVPQVLALVSDALRRGNTAITENNQSAIKSAAAEIRGALDILGCDPFDSAFNSGGKDLSEALDGVIQLALAQRAAARERKDFAASDAIRDGLAALGISIEDTPQGQRWTIKGSN